MIERTKLQSTKNIKRRWAFEAHFLPTFTSMDARITGMTYNEPCIDIRLPYDYTRFCEKMRPRQLSEKNDNWSEETTNWSAAI